MRRALKDFAASKLMLLITILSSLIFLVMLTVLIYKSVPILSKNSLIDLLFSVSWSPFKGDFGFLPFILSTIYVTGVAMIITIPISVLCSIYLAEYASNKIRSAIKPFIDLLAGIPSIIYGLWGLLLIVPFIKIIAPLFGVETSGYSILAGGIVLSIMIFPIIISVSEEILRNVPFEMREASFSLGATKWQTVKHVVIRKALPGIVAAITLGFSRAFGETMAVLMVVGNVVKIPTSVFDTAYPLPSLIANNYGEMMSIPLYDSALLFAALILFAIVTIFSILARITLIKTEKRSL